MHGTGRIIVPDERDKAFPMKMMLENLPRKRPQQRMWRSNWLGDQGGTSQCTIYSSTALWEAAPSVHSRWKKPYFGLPRPLWNLTEMYHLAQGLDPWPGSAIENPKYEGTTCRAAAKLLHNLGYIAGYTWEFGDMDVLDAYILNNGGVVAGTSWDVGMSTPDPRGFVEPGGPSLGGHAYYISGVKGGNYRIQNSWGFGWGIRGCAWIKREHLEKLLQDNGELMTLEEVM